MKIQNLVKFILVGVLLTVSLAHATSHKKTTSETPTFEMMNKRMTQMKNNMENIKKTKDPQKREVLINEHMKQMQAQSDMMGKMINRMDMMDSTDRKNMMSNMGQMHTMMGQMMGQMQNHMQSCPYVENKKAE